MFSDSYVEQVIKVDVKITYYIKTIFSCIIILLGACVLYKNSITIGTVILGVGICLFVYFTSAKYVEYEYTITNSSVEVAAIYNKKRRKELHGFDLSNVQKIVPGNSEEVKSLNYSKKYSYTSGNKDANVYAILADEGGKSILFFLEPNDKTAEHIRNYARIKMSGF